MKQNFKKTVLGFSLIFITLIKGAFAVTEYTFEDAFKQGKEAYLSQPSPETDGRIQTLNKKGAESPVNDEATRAFIETAKNSKVLEIGGAYGRVMHHTLALHPHTEYHLNDLDERHLFIAALNLQKSLEKGGIQPLHKDQVKFIAGNICKEFNSTHTYDSILVARVLHFFSPEQLEKAVKNLYSLLNPKGKVFVIAITPYVNRFKSFIPEYQKRLQQGETFPGYVSSLKEWVDKESTTPSQLVNLTEEPFMFLDAIVLKNTFEKQGFKILKSEMVPLSYFSAAWTLDGRENVILIAEKS